MRPTDQIRAYIEGLTRLGGNGELIVIARELLAEVERLTADAERQRRRAEDFEGRYETAHASRMWAEECFRRAERERDALRAAVAKVQEWCGILEAQSGTYVSEFERTTYGIIKADLAEQLLKIVEPALAGAAPTEPDIGDIIPRVLSVRITMTEAYVHYSGPGNVSQMRLPFRDPGDLYHWVRWACNIADRDTVTPITFPAPQEIGCTEDCGRFHNYGDGCALVPFEWREDSMSSAGAAPDHVVDSLNVTLSTPGLYVRAAPEPAHDDEQAEDERCATCGFSRAQHEFMKSDFDPPVAAPEGDPPPESACLPNCTEPGCAGAAVETEGTP